MARSDPQINFRIPQELKDALDAASAENRRSLTAEVVARLQQSFETRHDPDWKLRVAMHTNEVRLETLDEHLALIQAHIDQLRGKIEEAVAAGANPAAISGLQVELQDAEQESAKLLEKRRNLTIEGVGLEQARRDADREVLQLLDKLADSAMQDDLRDLHAREERLGLAKEARRAIILPPEKKSHALIPLTDGLATYKAMLEETLAKRDEKIRSWWQQEFGYDPEALQIKREPSKGPTRSQNAKKPLK